MTALVVHDNTGCLTVEDILVPAAVGQELPVRCYLIIRNRRRTPRLVSVPAETGSYAMPVAGAYRKNRPRDVTMGPVGPGPIGYPSGTGGLFVAAFTLPSQQQEDGHADNPQ